MASINEPLSAHDQAWNEAYDRLESFLQTFGLGDHAYVSKLSLDLIAAAKEKHRTNPSLDPTKLTLDLAQKRLADWLTTNLGQPETAPSQILSTGYIAILLSQVYRTAPTSLLSSPVPEELRHALRETLLVTGPDLNVSSMTPRHLDYGPMLQFAQQTWHRFSAQEFFVALLFWAVIYTMFYWWLSQVL